MDREELDIILKEGEGYKIEFKEGLSNLEKEMVAFANSSGGRIFLGATIFRRNHIIADLFARIDFGEKMGTGFERIREICQEENAPFPEIDYNEDYFYVIFRQSEEYLKLARVEHPPKTTLKLPGYYPETAQKIVDYILENPSITRQELAEMVGLSVDGVKYHIARLKKDGLVRRVGPARGGHWEVVRGDGSKTNP